MLPQKGGTVPLQSFCLNLWDGYGSIIILIYTMEHTPIIQEGISRGPAYQLSGGISEGVQGSVVHNQSLVVYIQTL